MQHADLQHYSKSDVNLIMTQFKQVHHPKNSKGTQDIINIVFDTYISLTVH